MKILLFGGHGLLGSYIRESIELDYAYDLYAPTRDEIDLIWTGSLHDTINKFLPDVIINCAAAIDNRAIELDPSEAVKTNIIGAANIALMAEAVGARYVYISTDYIYKGDRGNYKESDEILPFNLYAWTKLGGECSAKTVKNHLIIRTSFGKSEFTYSEAFTDKWSSKDYVDKIAPKILEAALSSLVGVLNIGTDRKTLFAHANERNNKVKPIRLSDRSFHTPVDTSMNLQKWIDYTGVEPISRPHTKCRICDSEDLIKYLDLGIMPLANNLEFTAAAARNKERFPLQVMLCQGCGLSQLSTVINPEKMFSYYTYRSSVNGGYVKHCRDMAIQLRDRWGYGAQHFMIDIAGNDGSLLQQFKEVIGLKILNIDPARNLATISGANGVPALCEFWGSSEVCDKVIENYGYADLITATNVFAHVDNVKGFLKSCQLVLNKSGLLVMEFPYLVNFIENFEFDTIYFEHLSYMSVLPLINLCSETDLKIISVEKQDIHGGTLRVTICHQDADYDTDENVAQFCSDEIDNGFQWIDKYHNWAERVKALIKDFSAKIFELKRQGKRIAAFAASAKGNTLLNACGMNTDIIEYIADETPEKIGKYSPGTGIPIVHKDYIIDHEPDYLIILSWNFAEEIIAKIRPSFTGKFIIPIPEFKVI